MIAGKSAFPSCSSCARRAGVGDIDSAVQARKNVESSDAFGECSLGIFAFGHPYFGAGSEPLRGRFTLTLPSINRETDGRRAKNSQRA
jgi:hypothetical protein